MILFLLESEIWEGFQVSRSANSLPVFILIFNSTDYLIRQIFWGRGFKQLEVTFQLEKSSAHDTKHIDLEPPLPLGNCHSHMTFPCLLHIGQEFALFSLATWRATCRFHVLLRTAKFCSALPRLDFMEKSEIRTKY